MTRCPEAMADVSDVDCTGQQALVTGSTSGIGRAAALALGRLGADVVVHGRDEAAGAEVVAELERVGADATLKRHSRVPGSVVGSLPFCSRLQVSESDS